MKIFYKNELMQFQEMDALIQRMEQGFVGYSKGLVRMPPVGHLHFEAPVGDLHIKSAARPKGDYYAVKVASCFPGNPKVGLNSIQGLILLFKQSTGEPAAIFLDEGYLTHLRTAAAGAVCAKHLAPKDPQAIGIIGAGAQARYQLQLLKYVTACRDVWVWAPNPKEVEKYCADQDLREFNILPARSAKEVAQHCRLIVTTTPATAPILFAEDIRPGTHITAIGSDRHGKQELDPKILGRAAQVVVDSRAQCFSYGETFCAIQAGVLNKEDVVELGEVLAGDKQGRLHADDITIADLTGLGIQDLEVAEALFGYCCACKASRLGGAT